MLWITRGDGCYQYWGTSIFCFSFICSWNLIYHSYFNIFRCQDMENVCLQCKLIFHCVWLCLCLLPALPWWIASSLIMPYQQLSIETFVSNYWYLFYYSFKNKKTMIQVPLYYVFSNILLVFSKIYDDTRSASHADLLPSIVSPLFFNSMYTYVYISLVSHT